MLSGLTAGAGMYAGALAGPGDPDFANVVFLTGFEGVDGTDFGAGFDDESSQVHGAATLSASGPTITTAQFRYGASAMSLPSAGGLTWADDNDFNFSSGSFTVESSIRPGTVAAGVHVICGQWTSTGNAGWVLAQSGATLVFRISTTGSNSFTDLASGSVFSASTWYDVAVDFDGTTYRLYVDGTGVASSTTLRTIFDSSAPFVIGHSYGGGGSNTEVFNGVIDELRITKGVARYAGASYTPGSFPRELGAPSAPINTGLPVISGTTEVGQTLTTTNGTWSNTPTGHTYQWLRDGVDISGATSGTYLLVTADLATTITVAVTATNAAGSASATSTGVGPITAGATTNNTALYISQGIY